MADKDTTPIYPEMRGRLALVTGGSSGIGLATAQAFAQQGARVIIASRNAARGKAAANKLKQLGEVHYLPVDTADGKSVATLFAAIKQQHGRLDYAFNNGGSGATRVSLRSIGAARTLVLINGRRMVPSGLGADDSVDLNSIPTAAIERVEVLKDGGSAVYGSDAIGGVINLITRKGFKGSEFTGFYGSSSRGDAQIADLNATAGTTGDQGNILFSFGFYDQKKSMAGDRDFSKDQFLYDSNGVNTGAFGPVPQGSSRVPGGRIRASRRSSGSGRHDRHPRAHGGHLLSFPVSWRGCLRSDWSVGQAR